MKKIAILGCENSHANNFLKANITDKMFADDIEFVGVFSEYEGAAEALYEAFGVPVMKSYDELVGKVDGIMVTARHGNNHYKYAKPYIASGIPMFLDKPITCNEAESVEFMRELKANNVLVTGGSSCPHAKLVRDLGKSVREGENGKVYGGYLRAPVSLENEYGGFWFYSQHLVQIMCEIFGYYPKSVMVFKNLPKINVTVRYEDYDVNITFVDGNYKYIATVSHENGISGGEFTLEGVFNSEFEEFHELYNQKQRQTYKEFIAPVFVMSAIERSIASGKEEEVHVIEEI